MLECDVERDPMQKGQYRCGIHDVWFRSKDVPAWCPAAEAVRDTTAEVLNRLHNASNADGNLNVCVVESELRELQKAFNDVDACWNIIRLDSMGFVVEAKFEWEDIGALIVRNTSTHPWCLSSCVANLSSHDIGKCSYEIAKREALEYLHSSILYCADQVLDALRRTG